ncbi:Hypothetical predicted protein [Cloeon dipterum]|uniref:Protein TsetseEP domain-containing protein n=1 Tax=Cloeon dipterum TaxID=197152 RepID=A0A8S1CET2_9INSE|nr:Hypothetical predicted protein [Cloeon dipterum]
MMNSGIVCWLLCLLVINAIVCEVHTTDQQENEPGEGLPNTMVNQSEGNEKSKNIPVLIANQSKAASAGNLIDSQQCEDVKNVSVKILEQVKNLTQDFNELKQFMETFTKVINCTENIRNSTLIDGIAALISSQNQSRGQLASATQQLSELFTEIKMDRTESTKVRLAIESYNQTIEDLFKSMEDMFQNDDRLTIHDLQIKLDSYFKDTIRGLGDTIRSKASEVRQFCETLKTDGDAEDIEDIKQNITTILANVMASSTVLTEITEKIVSLPFQLKVLFLVLVLVLLIQFVTVLVIVTCWWKLSKNSSYSLVNEAIPMRSFSQVSNIATSCVE